MAYRVLTRDEHYESPGPKRILALDGGGRGMRRSASCATRSARRGGGGDAPPGLLRFIAGTSTGAIITTALASGMSVDGSRTISTSAAKCSRCRRHRARAV
jgi:patatin-like phospholipase/acyl hydrolase